MNTIRIALIFGFRMLGLFMIFPILSTDAVTRFSATPTLIGIAIGIYGLTQASLQIPFGLLSDKYGRRKIIIIGLLLFIIGSLIAANAQTMWQLIIGRALQGSGAIASVLLAYLADLTKVTVRIRAMATVGMGIGCSFLLSLILAPWLYQHIGISGIFYATAILGGFGFILIFTIKEPSASSHKALEYQLSFAAMRRVLATKPLWILNITVMSIHATITMIFLFIPTLLIQHGMALSQHWQIYLSTMLISLVMTLPAIIYSEKKQKILPALVLSTTLLIVAFIVFLQDQSFSYLLLALTVFFISFNSLEALLPSSVSRISPVQYRGMALGIFSSHQFLGAFLGGTVGGLLLDEIGMMGLLFFAIALSTVSLALLLWIPIDFHQRSQTFLIAKNHPTKHVEAWATSQPNVLEAIYQQNSGALYLKTAIDFDDQIFHRHINQQFKKIFD